MRCLLDTNLLVRLANITDPDYRLASDAVRKRLALGWVLNLTPQNFIEFRNVATRPKASNGLGLTVPEAIRRASVFQAAFATLPDIPDMYPAWCVPADALGVVGKQVHDARLVAVCHARAVSQLLTFNVGHFARLAAAPPGVVVLDPATV